MQISSNKILKIYCNGKPPKKLFHITTKENYAKIQTSGGLTPLADDLNKSNNIIALFDLKNLLRMWKRSPDWGNENLAFMLIRQTLKFGTKELVCLSIPTEKLDSSALKIRSINLLYRRNQQANKAQNVRNGISAAFHNKIGRNQAIEFSYSKQIPIDAITITNPPVKVDLSKTAINYKVWNSKPPESHDSFAYRIISEFFKNQPEEKFFEK